MRKLLFLLAVVLACSSFAQETYPVNGTYEKNSAVYLLKNATIHVSSEVTLTGNLLFAQGKILAVGETEPIQGAVEVDMTGLHLYPSFIDLYSDYGTPEVVKPKRDPGPQDLSNKKGPFGWNQSIKPEVRAAEEFAHDSGKAEALRKAGFGALLINQQDGIARGTGAFVTLGENENKDLIAADAATYYSFRKGISTQNYPSSLMGAIALLRQTYCDANWYASAASRQEGNLSLEAWINNQALPQFFKVDGRLDVLRADKIADEFEVQYHFIGSGDEYQRLDALKETGSAFVVPLDFPVAYDVTDPYLARMVGLDELKHWELAASNPSRLMNAGIEVAFTADGLKDPSLIIAQLRKTIDAGLTPAQALKGLTETPASLVGMNDLLGTLETGKLANFIVASDDLFGGEGMILENWVQGKPYVIIDRNIPDLSGEYALTFNDKSYLLKVKGEPGKHKASFEVITQGEEGADTSMVKVKLIQEGEMINLQFGPKDEIFSGTYRLSGNTFKDRIWKGKGEDPNGEWFDWAAVKENNDKADEGGRSALAAEKTDSTTTVSPNIPYPFVAYGWNEKPEQETLLITNATIWTCEDEGIIEDGQVLIMDGKIKAVGKIIDLNSVFGRVLPDITILDVEGAHVTPGIIDEHSHIAISRGVNEGTQASSAEVSIATVVNSEDVNIYRQLSGGVTAAQLLHGSANPIGGQSGIIKLRWGLTPDEMLVDTDAPFIKFALGENVKQSNWGDYYRSRFPQTRMGVEQVYYDHFIRAKEYGEAWDAYEEAVANLTRRQKRKGEYPVPPRRDLELETLLQILEGERFVTCHSYRQDEINMLMHVADSMGFTLNTFTHILEGYKVADKMKEHGAGGSSFSDWWAYKFEVKDAIPYNGAILYEQGIVTAFNSDDAEMARRLNQEAAKAVKYGGVPEEEALKFVTLNPAKLLHLNHRMGSIKVGKDADLVIWTDHPLSIYAKARMTFIDGRRYFDLDRDAELRKAMKEERARLVQKMINAESGEGEKKKPIERLPHHYHCDTENVENR